MSRVIYIAVINRNGKSYLTGPGNHRLIYFILILGSIMTIVFSV